MKEKVKVKWSVMSVTVVLFIIMLGAILINAEKFYEFTDLLTKKLIYL